MNANFSHRLCVLRRWLLPCLAVSVAASCLAAQTKLKKLIEFGWDEPDTEFIRQHITEMERAPFDGCVFHANYRKSDGKTMRPRKVLTPRPTANP